MIKNIKWLLLVSLTFIACNNDDEAVVNNNSSDGLPLTSGSANFSKYVSLGNSLCAGYSDGALFVEGQKGSYPALLAQQFSLVGGGEFKIPFMADNIGGFSMGGTQIPQFGPRLYFNGTGPVSVAGPSGTDITAHLTGPFNNLGVPGAKSFHLVTPGYGALNPYFGRFASSSTTTVLADATSQTPTFFSLWIGNNDVLSYALSGGTGVNQAGNTNPATYGSNDITDPNVFAQTYTALVNGLTANGAKGVVANIPYVNSIPYFTTVPYNAVPLNSAQVSALNSGYAAYNGGLLAAKNAGLISETERVARTINFVVGQNPVVIVDEYLTTVNVPGVITLPNYRQATSADYVLLLSGGVSAQAHLAGGNGTQFPLADNWILSKGEVAELKTATDAFNTTIQSLATSKNLAFVNANAVMAQVANGGIAANGFNVTSAYVTGGGFSLDGVHPSPRGYALLANKFIESINTKYGSNLKGVNIGDYRILFPASL